MPAALPAFKAYDIRGRLPDELNADLTYRIGRAYPDLFEADEVVIGHDCRLTSPELADALAAGLVAGGARVHDIGLCGTEEVYFATFHHALAGGIMITASHNPIDYNGLKLVRRGAAPISADTGLGELAAAVQADDSRYDGGAGARSPLAHRDALVAHLVGLVDVDALRPLKIVVNAGNGCAGPLVDALAPALPFEFIRIHHQPDGNFPNGIPNPMLEENRKATANAVQEHNADMGLAWDGDFDRCFFFDENGQFIDGYYLVGLLAAALLPREPGGRVIHDPRLYWNTHEIVADHGGRAVQCRCGHAFIKDAMRAEQAIYGGEMSAHHYFRDFGYCDTGTLPWLLIAELICREGTSLGELLADRMARFPISGEINRKVDDAAATIAAVAARYEERATQVDRSDGLSLSFDSWRFNLRASNTEPLLRLNVEARGDAALVREMTTELLAMM